MSRIYASMGTGAPQAASSFPFAPLAIGFGVANAALAAFGASSRNRAIKRQYGYNQRAAETELAQQGRIFDLQVARSRKDAARAAALVAVSGAERGVGSGGSTAALDRQVAIDQDENQYALEIDRYGAEQRTLANLRLAQENLKSQSQPVALAALGGLIGGAQTGLSIGQGLDWLTR